MPVLNVFAMMDIPKIQLLVLVHATLVQDCQFQPQLEVRHTAVHRMQLLLL